MKGGRGRAGRQRGEAGDPSSTRSQRKQSKVQLPGITRWTRGARDVARVRLVFRVTSVLKPRAPSSTTPRSRVFISFGLPLFGRARGVPAVRNRSKAALFPRRPEVLKRVNRPTR